MSWLDNYKVSPEGQWKYPGQKTAVPTPTGSITMKGVPYPVMGVDNTGHSQMMMPGMEYQFPGNMVFETPMMQNGGTVPLGSTGGMDYAINPDGSSLMIKPSKGDTWVQLTPEKSKTLFSKIPELNNYKKTFKVVQEGKDSARPIPEKKKHVPQENPVWSLEKVLSKEPAQPKPKIDHFSKENMDKNDPLRGVEESKPPGPLKIRGEYSGTYSPQQKSKLSGEKYSKAKVYPSENTEGSGLPRYLINRYMNELGDNFDKYKGYAQYWKEKNFGISEDDTSSELKNVEEAIQPVVMDSTVKSVEKPKSGNKYNWQPGKAYFLEKDNDRDYSRQDVDFWGFRRTTFNDEGMTYIPTSRLENHKGQGVYNVARMAHFLIDSDLTDGRKTDETLDAIKRGIENNEYLPIYKKDGKGVTIKYIKGNEPVGEGWDYAAALRQIPLSNIDWDKSARPYLTPKAAQKDSYKRTGKGMFGKGIMNVLTKDGKDTYMVYKEHNGKDKKLGRFNGNSLVFIIEKDGQRIIRDFTGTIANIEKESRNLLKEFNVNDDDITLAFYDQGSYSAKPKANKEGYLPYKSYNVFNPDKYSGAGLAIPFDQLEPNVNFQEGGNVPFDLPLKSANPGSPWAYESPTAGGYLLPDVNRPELLNTGATEYKAEFDGTVIPTVVNGQYMDPNNAYKRYMLTGEKYNPEDLINPTAYSNFYDEVNKLGIMKQQKGGWLSKYQSGGATSRKPIYVDSKNDPRYQAYADSMFLYNYTKGNINLLKNLQNQYGDFKAWQIFTGDTLNESLDEYQERNKDVIMKVAKATNNGKVQPIKKYQINDYSNVAEEYKKPVQPVEVRKGPQKLTPKEAMLPTNKGLINQAPLPLTNEITQTFGNTSGYSAGNDLQSKQIGHFNTETGEWYFEKAKKPIQRKTQLPEFKKGGINSNNYPYISSNKSHGGQSSWLNKYR